MSSSPAGVDQLERKVVPHVPVGVAVGARELLAQARQLWVRVVGRRLGVDAARGLADERKPLLPLAAAVGGDEVLLLAERRILDVRAARRVARDAGLGRARAVRREGRGARAAE